MTDTEQMITVKAFCGAVALLTKYDGCEFKTAKDWCSISAEVGAAMAMYHVCRTFGLLHLVPEIEKKKAFLDSLQAELGFNFRDKELNQQ